MCFYFILANNDVISSNNGLYNTINTEFMYRRKIK